MPVDTTKAAPARRAQRKVTEEELKDIELKRIRGELSCAECRRLKLRCDKKVPCSSCCRRGCESICPCGILSAGQGTRFILADTEQLHRKIAEMSHRIRQLEDALAILQSTVSGDRHPLLQDDLLKIKFGAEALNSTPSTSDNGAEEATKQSIDALGTLTLGDSGEMKYFGRSAGSETLMLAGEEWDAPSAEDDDARTPLPPELENLANLFPFTTKRRPNAAALDILESFLPQHERAWALCESYLDHGSYFFRPIKRDELMDTLLPTVYNTASARQLRATESPGSGGSQSDEDSPSDSCTPHNLATLFFLFAMGALLDLRLPPYNSEADHYYDLGRAALSLRPVFDSPQVTTVQAVGLMATYHSLAGKKYSRDSAWSLMSVAAKLAQSIGLHRDSARWNLDARTVQRRRSLFWDIFAADVSHSLALGRPPSIHLSYVDCEFPIDEEATLNDAQEIQSGFWRMKHAFAKDIFMAVAEATLTAKSPSYDTVLDLDRKVRELSFPAALKPYVRREDGEKEYYSSSLSLRGFYASQHRTVTMLYLHRSFFAQAMLDHPANPLLSPFAQSFLTAYRCASIIIKATAHQFDRCAEMAMRVWFLLYHTFSAAVIVGTVVTHSPNSSMASSALLDLGLAVELFEKASAGSRRAKIALIVLRKLKEKAVRAYTQFCSATLPTQINSINSSPASLLSSSFSPIIPQDDVEDELAIFGGQTRVLACKSRHSSSRNSPQSGSMDSPSPPPSGTGSSPSPRILNRELNTNPNPSPNPNPNTHAGAFLDVHPSLVEYLSSGGFLEAQAQPNMSGHTSPTQEQLQYGSTALMNSNGGGGMGEVYQSFMAYLANRSITNASAFGPSALPPGSALEPPAPADWAGRALPTHHQGQGQSQDSMAWSQSPQRPITSHGFGNSGQRTSGSAGAPPSLSQNQSASSNVPSNYGYDSSVFVGGYNINENGYGSVSPSEAMVELGLTTESGMDEGWLSFMQDCGIMENGRVSA